MFNQSGQVRWKQNHRMVQVQRDSWRSSAPFPPAQTGPHGPCCPGPCPDFFFTISTGGDSTISLGNLLNHCHSVKLLPDVQREHPVFQCVPTASGLGTGHCWCHPLGPCWRQEWYLLSSSAQAPFSVTTTIQRCSTLCPNTHLSGRSGRIWIPFSDVFVCFGNWHVRLWPSTSVSFGVYLYSVASFWEELNNSCPREEKYEALKFLPHATGLSQCNNTSVPICIMS